MFSCFLAQKVSEYDQEIPQSHTVDHPTAPTVSKSHRTFTVTRHPKDNKSKANKLFVLRPDDCKTRKDIK